MKPGAGLWLRLHGGDTVEWTRPAEPDGSLLWLSEGVNLVAVADPEAVERLVSDATTIRRWDAARQRYVQYASGEGGLRRGDAIRLDAPHALNWWQAATRPPPVGFFSDVPIEQRDDIPTQYDSMETFFAERFERIARGALLLHRERRRRRADGLPGIAPKECFASGCSWVLRCSWDNESPRNHVWATGSDPM